MLSLRLAREHRAAGVRKRDDDDVAALAHADDIVNAPNVAGDDEEPNRLAGRRLPLHGPPLAAVAPVAVNRADQPVVARVRVTDIAA